MSRYNLPAFLAVLLITIGISMSGAEAAARPSRMLASAPAPTYPNWQLATPVKGLSIHNISGVWVGYGDQFSTPVWASYFNDTLLPNCSVTPLFTYKHWSSRFPDTLGVAADNDKSKKGYAVNGHEDTTYIWANMTFDGQFLRYTPSWGTESVCSRYSVYVDNRDGSVFSRLVSKSLIKLVSGKLDYADVPCDQVPETEVAGCFPGKNGSVYSVSVSTHKCTGGTCLRLSPAFQEFFVEQ